MLQELKESLAADPENPFLQGHVEGLENAEKKHENAAHAAAWEKNFVIPIGREMKKRGITYMVMILRDDGKLAYTLDTENSGERLGLPENHDNVQGDGSPSQDSNEATR